MNSHEVFSGFYRRHYRDIFTVAHKRVGNRAEAEDITADVFCITWRHYVHCGDLSLPWVYQVLRNKVGEEYRRYRRAQELLTKLETYSSPLTLHDHNAENFDINRALEALPAKSRKLLKMAYWKDFSPKEIGLLLGISPTTIRVRLLRARNQFKTKLSESLGTAKTTDFYTDAQC